MANPLHDLLPSDPATLKNLLVWVGPVWLASLGVLWKAAQLYYKGQVETAQQRVTFANEQVVAHRTKSDETQAKLDALKPGEVVAFIEAEAALTTKKANAQIEVHQEQARQAEARMRAIEVERDHAVATVQQRQDQAAELARLSQHKAVAEARIQELQASIEQAHQLAEGIQAAALRQTRKEQQEYEANKDTIRHRFVKREDARAEFETLRERGISEGKVPSDPEPEVDFWDLGDGKLMTQVAVVGHDWYVYLRGREGWGFFAPSTDDHVGPAIQKWSDAFARIRTENRNFDVGWHWTVGRDYIEMHVHDRARVTHSLAVLATIKRGYPTPMALYLSGEAREVEHGFRRWRREHGTGMAH